MRKTALGLAILLAVSSISLAMAGSKKADPNAAGKRFVRDALVLVVPTPLLPFYLKHKGKQEKH